MAHKYNTLENWSNVIIKDKPQIKCRRIDAVTIIKRLEIKQPEFVDNLYRAFELKNENDYFDSFYKNEYIRKWISIEDRFRSKGIDVNPKDYPRGVAVNLQLIEEYLDEQAKRYCAMINNFRGQNFFLSNFYTCKIRFEGLEYKCVESAFQSAKTFDEEVRKQFCNLSAKDAKAKGRKVELRDDWEDVKDDIMYQLVKYKFTHSSKLKWMLKKTGTVELVEGNNWNDTYWGKCNGRGQNKLGIILMRVRSELLECE